MSPGIMKPASVVILALGMHCLVLAQAPPAPPELTRAKIMMLGTFHFDDQGLDGHKSKHRLDILSSRRQREIEELLKALAQLRPTKIAVEWRAEGQADLDAAYSKYLAAKENDLGPNEIYQLGFRLARRLGQTKVYAVDAPDRPFGPTHTTEALIERAQSLGQNELIGRATKWLEWYEALDNWQDEIKTKQSLKEHLQLLNSPQSLRYGLGRYLMAQFEVGGGGDYTGADWRTGWYNRNLRIFSNLLRVRKSNSDRILLIIGAGHIPLLLQMAENAPEFGSVSVSSVLSPSQTQPTQGRLAKE